ncbi:hypothetical protein PPN31114_01759 [Pandoraea pneumonica]|jgi:hypothetical protein|uniref:DUF5624 domain-containing protein n=1 Tax=Pandoraea pneumonica TaxID=2508299 RepID=A0A5E4U0A3_9BURK|nr:DUF5624 domain-containing protein [Pandoraea pneumonica]VVD92922.1 hypothetical protein PPN31114_01759 [Pandoraea pneumonica]
MSYQPHAAFAGLFHAFTSDPQSLGNRLAKTMSARDAALPLLVSTGSDIALFPGNGAPAQIESFRKSTRGFIELTAVSHLPLALAYLARLLELGELDDDGQGDSETAAWRAEAKRLIEHAANVRKANTLAHWRDDVAVQSLRGNEAKLVDLIDYTCDVSSRWLTQALADPSRLTFERLVADYFEAQPGSDLPVPMNDVMFATFGLAYLDIVYRIGNWLRAQSLDWSRAMVIVSGRSGRPTAGATWSSNNMCHLIWRASGERLPPERLLVAPHAPGFSVANLGTADDLRSLEAGYRELWHNTRASIEVAREMFPHAPGFSFAPSPDEAMPPLADAQDRKVMAARLRRIMEDPAQLLSNCVADYIVDELARCDNDPSRAVIPGFTQVNYPPHAR